MDAKKKCGGAKKNTKQSSAGKPVRPRLIKQIMLQILAHPKYPDLSQEKKMAIAMVGNRGHLYHLIYEVWDFLYLGTPIPVD